MTTPGPGACERPKVHNRIIPIILYYRLRVYDFITNYSPGLIHVWLLEESLEDIRSRGRIGRRIPSSEFALTQSALSIIMLFKTWLLDCVNVIFNRNCRTWFSVESYSSRIVFWTSFFLNACLFRKYIIKEKNVLYNYALLRCNLSKIDQITFHLCVGNYLALDNKIHQCDY